MAQVLEDLADDGFDVNLVERTWLGRVRVVGTRGGTYREIVVDPRNGVILRDLRRLLGDDDGDGSGSGGDDDDDRDDDDDDDDDDGDDDNSGPGENSGPGGGGDDDD
ncbi:hypothetical protein HKCCE3408_08150 [Rhodobacterales bacterium HKCCE3408]|nr:hypothetical protein [Rhodobacterales bacterium HKCCE3408]